MEKEEIAPKEQFLLFSTIFCYLLLDFHVETGTRFTLRDKRLFEISEIEKAIVDCIYWKCRISVLDISDCDLDVPRKRAYNLETTETLVRYRIRF